MREKCVICDEDLTFRWLDFHGVGACINCNAPYQIYFYDENNKSIEAPPKFNWFDYTIPVLREYWQTHKRKVCPGSGCLPGSDRILLSEEDFKHFKQFCHPELDKAKALCPDTK